LLWSAKAVYRKQPKW